VAVTTVERSALFADIAASTRLIVEHGDDAARVLLVRYVGLLADTARSGGGEIANLLGDEVFCIFAQPDDAVAAAAAMHEAVEASSIRDRLERPIRIRVGFEHGSLVHSDEGWFGNTVHRAARLVALAKAGQILTTQATLDRLDPRWQRAARWFDRCVLRGGRGEEEIHEILWSTTFTSVLAPSAPQPSERGPIAAVDLFCGVRRVRVDAAHPRAELGRDPACDLQVASTAVSRLHAAVEWNRGRVQLTDLSTNGTTIERAGAAEERVHHDSAALDGEGVLRLGDRSDDSGSVVYRCVRAT
jgi:adenylate cyclase